MACGGCVEKLALRLVRNHRLDWIDALVRAEKGIKRYENRTVHGEGIKIGNPSDYTQPCVAGGSLGCSAGDECYDKTDCWDTRNCTCSCPDPLPNSHYVSDECVTSGQGCSCVFSTCSGVGQCTCLFSCYYDCNEGFEWDGEACVEVVAKRVFGDGLVWVVS